MTAGDAGLAVAVRDLRIELLNGVDVVDEVEFTILEGEVLALVGESGCGKTSTAMACLGFARPGSRIVSGEIVVGGTDVLRLSGPELRRFRGSEISFVPQDPSSALNPGLRIGSQIEEMLAVHRPSEPQRADRVRKLLEAVQLPSGDDFLRRYSHQLSGGQQQRVVIAMSLACRPRLLVLDEPTTGLDVTTQARILAMIDELRRQHHLSMLYVTHDLAVVAQLADRVAVMYGGRIVESAPKNGLFLRPRHPYTQRLLAAIPGSLERRRRLKGIPGSAVAPGERPAGCFFAPRCEHATDLCAQVFPPHDRVGAAHTVRCHHWQEIVTPDREASIDDHPGVEAWRKVLESPLLAVSELVATYPERALGRHALRALEDVSFELGRYETLGVVGESGSGKTTLARCIVGLHRPAEGAIVFNGVELAGRAIQRGEDLRRRIQIVFQNPDSSLNPRQSVAQIVERPLRQFFDLRGAKLRTRAAELLELVRLPQSALKRYPRDLSGGENQRVAIAAALAPRPDLVVCDEITSALDVSVQAAIIELLIELGASLGTSFLFISHDLAVVRAIADRVLVLQRGQIREHGDADAVFRNPKDAYTQALLDAVPEIRVGSDDAVVLG